MKFDFNTVEPAAYKAIANLEKYVRGTGLDARLLDLIRTRVSQLNGCAFCLDMHTREALELGESPQRLYTLSAWRETPFFTSAEQAALALAEAITRPHEQHGFDELTDAAAEFFTTEQIVQLITAIITINSWNRLALASGKQPVADAQTLTVA